jgi:simple sugar transport system permease protein
MTIMGVPILAFIITLVGATTPLLLAATGELVVEKSGVLNLGVEGMMLTGAVVGFAVTYTTGSPWLGIVAAAIAGAAVSMIFGFLTLTLSSNQVATGLALTIFGIGFSALFGQPFTGKPVDLFKSVFPPELAQHEFFRVIFGYSPLVYLSLIMLVLVWWFLQRTRAGLILRAVGESDISAHSIGYNVIGVRYAAVAFGGVMAGVAGSCFPLMLTNQWVEELTAGRGWIALALVVFASWRPLRLLAGAYIFGIVATLEVYAKSGDAALRALLPSQMWAALPYLATILVLVLISLRRSGSTSAPACLGRPFVPSS